MLRGVVCLGLVLGISSTARAQRAGLAEGLHLRIETEDENVELFRYGGSQTVGNVITTFYEPICRAPCEVVVDKSYPNEYYVGGKGVPTTDTFSLERYSGQATMRVEAGNSVPMLLGAMSAALGGTGVLVGVIGFLIDPKLATYITVPSAAALAGGVYVMRENATKYEILAGDAARPGTSNDHVL